jgi:hypothetical protein
MGKTEKTKQRKTNDYLFLTRVGGCGRPCIRPAQKQGCTRRKGRVIAQPIKPENVKRLQKSTDETESFAAG